MNGNFWGIFFGLLVALFVGFEIGKSVMARKIRELLSQVGDMLKESADKLQKDREKQRIESAARMDDILDRLRNRINRDMEKEGETIESSENG